MKIDIAVPTYRGLMQPAAKKAMDDLLNYSRCTCFAENSELAVVAFDAAQNRKKANLPNTNPFHHPSHCPLGKHDIYVIDQVDASVVHWARNDLLQRRRPEADYVLFCDDDIVVERDTLERLIAHKKDIVAPLCTRRTDPPEPNFRQWMEELQNYGVILKWPVGKFLEIDAIGTGVMLLSRRVIEDVARAYHPGMYRDNGNGIWFEFLRNPYGYEWGEDMSFCWKAQRLGYGIFCDTSILPLHQGLYGFGIEDWLSHQD